MNIICDKTLLSAAIDGVSKAVTLRSTIPVLEGILLKAEGFQLTLTGYDLEMGIVTTIDANVKEPGEVVLNAKLLSSMVSRMPSGQINIQSAENGKTTIQSGVAQFEIQSMNPTDFPELPNTGAEETLNIKTGVLRDMIERTLYAVSQDEKKPAHTGELFEISPDKLTVVALDGYRLAIVERPVEAIKEIRIIVPSKTMNEVSHLLANDDEETVHISANRRYVVFTTAGYTIMSRLIEGEFLNYHNVIPNGSRTSVVLDTKEFIETIERASLIITERLKNPLRISFTEGKVVVRCQTNLGRVVDEFNAQCEGDEVEIGFNNRYLLDALRMAYLMQAYHTKERGGCTSAYDMLKVATVNGAKTLGRTDLGTLEAGKAADLFMIDTETLELAGALHDPKNLLARVGLTGPVWMTMINGNIVYKDGILKGVDERKLAMDGEAVCTRVIREPHSAYRDFI